MTDQVTLACTISSSDPTAKIGLEIWLEDIQIYNTEHVVDPVNFVHELADTEGNHQLQFVMKNKTETHTIVDKEGNILSDCCICVSDISFDEIQLGQIFVDRAVYEHNFNGTADAVQDKFYGEMGCNGTVTLEFTTPIYLWFLEHM